MIPARAVRIRSLSVHGTKAVRLSHVSLIDRLIRGVPWLAILGLVIAALQGWIAWSQKRVADQQTAVAVGERLDKLSAEGLQTKHLLGQLRLLQVPLIVPVYDRTCSTEAQCAADVMKAFKRQGRSAKRKYIEAPAKTPTELLLRTFESHILFAQVFLASAYEAPFNDQRAQARALINDVIRPGISICGFTNSSGSELVSAIDTVTHLSLAALSTSDGGSTYIAAMIKLRANFGVPAASPTEPYPMREYILDIRRMYSVLDRVPLALADQCEAANTFIEQKRARLELDTGTALGLPMPKARDCPLEDKCGGLVSVEFYWHPADGCKRMNDPGRGRIEPPASSASQSGTDTRC